MQKKIMWLGLCILLVAATVLASCNNTTTSTTVTSTLTSTKTSTTTSTTTSTAAASTTTPIVSTEPQYGGTLTAEGYRTTQPPTTWDFTVGGANTDYWVNPYGEYLLTGDIEGQGPRGSNAYNFQLQETVPPQFLTGQLATTWEQPDPLTLIFHIRQGVMWTGNANIGMAAREFTANDAAFELNRYWKSINGGTNLYYLSSITATNQFTLTIKLNTYTPDWLNRLGYGYKCEMIPPEEVVASNSGAANWKNQVGTGPFILTNYVAGSFASYDRNPNYWGKTTINGKTYETPFIQTLVLPVVVDQSTQIASIRTGKMDVAFAEPIDFKATLNSTSPDLIIFPYLKNNFYQVGFRCDTGIFTNVNVRRAMMIGTDVKSIGNAIYPGGYALNAGPAAPNLPGVSSTVNEYPQSTQELFTYVPTTAKQMLADAGYPNGFTCEITCQSNSTEQDMCSLLADQWSKLNVTLKIKAVDPASWTTYFLKKSYSDILLASIGNANLVSILGYKAIQGPYNASNWVDTKAEALYNQAVAETDTAKQNALYKQLNAYIIDQCSMIAMPAPDEMGTYWPWVKNYYQEIEAGYHNYTPMMSSMWIDEGLKAKLGY